MKVALLVFTESKSREDAFLQRVNPLKNELSIFEEKLKGEIDLFIPEPFFIRDKKDLLQALSFIERESGICGCILYAGTFISASDIAMAARLLSVPVALIGNDNPSTVSLIGFLAAAGALQQAGLPFKRIDKDIKENGTVAELKAFFTAAEAGRKLKGETFGMIGGRSLGISTGTADGAQWLKKFGIDITHIDQFELVDRAAKADKNKIESYKKWVNTYYGRVNYQEGRFTENHLEKMISSYLAVKDMISDYCLDFAGIKCQPDLSNRYVLQCFTIQLLNDRYDAEGEKEAFVCSCEADADGALSMEILKHISNGKPTSLQDIFCFENHNNIVLANCGSGASYFSAYSTEMEENLKNVYLQPHGFGAAGGASVQFNYAPGTNTLIRLYRNDNNYNMLITRGKVLKRTREDLKKYSWYRPTSIMELECDNDTLRSQLFSNHLLCVEGDYVSELQEYCELNDIRSSVIISS